MGFVHLHLHTEYSLLDGACRISEIPDAVLSAGQNAVAITDHGVMYGVVDFYKACKEKGIKPIIGCEVYVAPRDMEQKDRLLDSDYSHLVLLAKNQEGYKNLITIVSKGFTVGFYQKPRTDISTLEKHSAGLVALSGCISGSIPKAILGGDMSLARERIIVFNRIFGKGNFFLELQRHGIKGQEDVNRALIRFSKELDVPLVATNDAHYISRADAPIQKLLSAVATGNTLEEGGFGIEGSEHYIKTAKEMELLFRDVPDALENTGKIAEMCNFDFDFDTMHLPVFRPPSGFSAEEYLRKLCSESLKKLSDSNRLNEAVSVYEKRLDYELSIIHQMGFDDYFLIVWDFVNFARTNGIPVGSGRGSAVGSLCAYLLGITQVDPIKFGLLFERFLNPERVTMPDIDIDFSDERRGEVIDYVASKYGRANVAQIITFGKLACRQAVRDTGRALGMSYASVDEIAKMIPRYHDVTLENALKENPQLKSRYDNDPAVKRLIDLAGKLEGRPRNTSTHASGVVITDKPLVNYLPLSVNDDTITTQFTMTTLENLGLLKIDFLGLRFLSVIQDTEKLVRKKIPDFSSDNIPLDDEKTFDMLSNGLSKGTFQLESEGMRNLLTKLRPRNLEDIISVISLYRPGPALSIDTFLKNRIRPQNIKYADPRLESILKTTSGVILYQEQVMEICRKLAGYSYGRADLVRRAMAKKKLDVMAKEKDIFLEGALKNGVDRQVAEDIFDQMSEFAKYAFNKSHAAAYAVVAYKTAYLKCHFPCEYMCSLEEKIRDYMDDLKRMGIKILPPSVNKSEPDFSIEGNNIRFGLASIKNVGLLFADKVIEQRNFRRFSSIEDFISRCASFGNQKAFESMIIAGALDEFGLPRSQMVAGLSAALETVSRDRNRNFEGQMSLFGGNTAEETPFEFPKSDIPEFRESQKLSGEKEMTGLYFSGHPLEGFKKMLSHVPLLSSEEIRKGLEAESIKKSDKIKFLGLVTKKRSKITKKNDIMAFITAEDERGEVELIMFPSLYAEIGERVSENGVYVFQGNGELKEAYSEEESERVTILLKSVSTPQEEAEDAPKTEKTQETPPKSLYIKATKTNSQRLTEAIDLAAKEKGDSKILVYFEEEKKLRAAKGKTTKITENLLSRLGEIMGSENIAVK